jgi:serine/threonine-protein kinase
MVEGTVVGAYRVLRQIGQGGMGTVWLAEHVQLGRQAAIKVLLPELSVKPDVVQRFFNEARAATAITDPGIVQIFDYGQHTDGSAYIVMELLDGQPLDRRLADQGALPIRDALRIVRQVASTLGAAHARGIVHRDIKPENIFLVRDPEVASGERAKVLDFGIAKLGGTTTGIKTQTATMMGTPVYMSPEQCRGAGAVDARSDVYSLGCVLFVLLTRRAPFVADGVGELIVMHITVEPPAPSSVRSDVPPEVDRLVLRCLAKEPGERFASGAELALEIGAMLGSLPSQSAVYPRMSTPLPIGAQTTLSASAVSTVSPRGPRSKLPAILGLAVATLGAAAVGFVVLHGHDDAPPPTAAAPAAMPAAMPAPPAPPAAPPAAAKPVDPRDQLPAQTQALFARFSAWAKDHAGAPCPDAAALGDAPDPWGHPYRITCADQPGDQIMGAISAGPDGTAGTDDDIASWQLARDVTDAVRGARWTVQPTPAIAKTVPVPHRKQKPPVTKPTPTNGLQLDENGLPITR